MSRRALLLMAVPVTLALVAAGAWYGRGLLSAGGLRPRWEQLHGSEAAFEARFPLREANETALEVERLAWSLGFNLSARGLARAAAAQGRATEDTDLAQAKQGARALARTRFVSLDASSPVRGVAAAGLERWLSRHSDRLLALEDALVAADGPPLWEHDGGSRSRRGPSPQALLDLQDILLVRAWLGLSRGEDELGHRSLLAAWRLIEALGGRPEFYWRKIHQYQCRKVLALLRLVGSERAVEWIERLDGVDLVALWRETAAAETLRYLRAVELPRSVFKEQLSFREGGADGWADAFLRGSRSGASKAGVEQLSEPYVRSVVASAIGLHLDFLKVVDVAPPCRVLGDLHAEEHRGLVSLEPGATFVIESELHEKGWRTAQRYQHELELTRWALSVRARLGGDDVDEYRPACSSWWDRSAGLDGALTLRFVGPDPQRLTTAVWPDLRLTISPDGFSR